MNIAGYNFLKFWMLIILLKEFFPKPGFPQSFLFFICKVLFIFCYYLLIYLFIHLHILGTSIISYPPSLLAPITLNFYGIIFNNYCALPLCEVLSISVSSNSTNHKGEDGNILNNSVSVWKSDILLHESLTLATHETLKLRFSRQTKQGGGFPIHRNIKDRKRWQHLMILEEQEDSRW